MTYSKVSISNSETKGGEGQASLHSKAMTLEKQNQACEKVYGYIDLFKNMGDTVPLETFPLTQSKVTIGRDHNCHVQIDNARVSRLQCAILVIIEPNGRNFQVRLQNLTSRLTTIHRGAGIVCPGAEVPLAHGDRFRLYDIELRYRLYDPVNEKGQLDWSKPVPKPLSVKPQYVAENSQNEPQLQKAKLPVPTIKITKPPAVELNSQNSIKSSSSYKSRSSALNVPQSSTTLDQRRQSSPLPISPQQRSKLDLLRLPRWSSMKILNQITGGGGGGGGSKSGNVSGNVPSNNKNSFKTFPKSSTEDLRNSRNNSKNLPSSGGGVKPGDGNVSRILPGNVSLNAPPPVAYKRRGSSDFDMRKAVLQRSFRRAFKEKLSQGTLNLNDVDLNGSGHYKQALEDFIVLSSAA